MRKPKLKELLYLPKTLGVTLGGEDLCILVLNLLLLCCVTLGKFLASLGLGLLIYLWSWENTGFETKLNFRSEPYLCPSLVMQLWKCT